MTSSRDRRPAGTATGGQFAARQHPESEMTLPAEPAAQPHPSGEALVPEPTPADQRGYLDDETCPNCGGEMTWCDSCVMWSRSCCETWGTCMCS